MSLRLQSNKALGFDVQQALSLYLRLGFAKKKNFEELTPPVRFHSA